MPKKKVVAPNIVTKGDVQTWLKKKLIAAVCEDLEKLSYNMLLDVLVNDLNFDAERLLHNILEGE